MTTAAGDGTQFWLATLPLSGSAADCQVLALAEPPEADAPPAFTKGAVAVEVWRWGWDAKRAYRDNATGAQWAILVSTTDDEAAPAHLTCVFGVSNDPLWCDAATMRGFPVIEGTFESDGDRLTVKTAVYSPRKGISPSSPEQSALIHVEGLSWETPVGSDANTALNPLFEQLQTSPDLGEADSLLVGRRITCDPQRSAVNRVDAVKAGIEFANVLYPDLALLPGRRNPSSAWRGLVGDSRFTGSPAPSSKMRSIKPASPGRPLSRFKRQSVFGAPAFVFEDVDIIGFRIDVRSGIGIDGRALLAGLIDDLNFHLKIDKDGAQDFRYLPATTTVVVELLRYGKMKCTTPMKPLEPDDFMSQHELIVRVLVGRVDDDAAQARDPAVFVPAIFVDNPWSKAAGRHLQGFPKMLAAFCVDGQPLQMNGRRADGTAVSLTRVSQVRLVDRVGDPSSTDVPILALQCPEDAANDDGFDKIDLSSLFGDQLFSGVPWRQGDFMDRLEFRRSFARDVITNRFNEFRSVQVSPVDEIGLPKTWIAGRFSLDNVAVAFPTGVVTLAFGAPPRCPPAWKTLGDSLRAAYGDTIGFPTGSWYRVRCSMNLVVEDALSW